MTRMLVAAAFIAAAMPMTASAQTERLSDTAYVAAARCLAFAEVPALSSDTFDVTALQRSFDEQRGARARSVREQVREAERDVRLAGSRHADSERGVAHLREQRDLSCANFVSSGLVQLPTATPAS